MEAEHTARWERIRQHPLDQPGVTFPFSIRLARENGWTHAFALSAIEEYRRFALLAIVSERPVTPSDEIDQVWHLHLTYTRDYWGPFCRDVLGRPLHHVPTEGGPDEHDKHVANYVYTLERYRMLFDEEPPAALWPAPAQRFGRSRHVRVDLARRWLLPRPGPSEQRRAWLRPLVPSLSLAALLLGCTRLDGPDFLAVFVVFMLVVFLGAWPLERWLVDRRAPEGAPELDVFGVAYLTGGEKRVLHVALARLMRDGAVRLDDHRLETTTSFSGPPATHAGLSPEARALEVAVARELKSASPERVSLWHLHSRVGMELQHIAQQVRASGLVPPLLARRAALFLTLTVPLIGSLRVVDGMTRGKPVIIVALLSFFALIASLLLFAGGRRLGSAGERFVTDYRTQYAGPDARSDGEPGNDLAIRALATLGAAALIDPRYVALARTAEPTGDSGSSVSGCSDSSDGGSGGCGGGCGGCS